MSGWAKADWMSSEPMRDRVVVVTGAGSGIGAGAARVLAAAGARLVLNDLREEYLSSLIEELPGDGHLLVAGDISVEATAEALVSAALERWGRIDGLVSNVGLMHFKDIDEVSVEEFDHVMGVNVRGMFLICKHVIPVMVRQQSGSIVIVTSPSGYRGQEFDGTSTFVYNMSKAATRQLSTSLATRYARDGIRSNALAPGTIRTKQVRHFLPDMSAEDEDAIFAGATAPIPLGRTGTPEEMGAVILFLLSDQSSFVTGHTLFADGGHTAKLL